MRTGRNLPDGSLEVELRPLGTQDLGLAAHAVGKQLRRCDRDEAGTLLLDGAPERTELNLSQVAIVLRGRHLHHSAQRQRRVRLDDELLNRVVVDLLDDHPHALGRVRRQRQRLDDAEHIGRSHAAERLRADQRPDKAFQPRQDLRAIGRRARRQSLLHPALRERFELVGATPRQY